MRGFKRGGIEELKGISAEMIAEICGCHITTARRWKKGEQPPLSALKICALYQTGELGTIDLKWNGWRLRDGLLVSPDGQYFTPGNVMSGPFWQQLAKSYQADQRFPAQGDWISEKWEKSADYSDLQASA